MLEYIKKQIADRVAEQEFVSSRDDHRDDEAIVEYAHLFQELDGLSVSGTDSETDRPLGIDIPLEDDIEIESVELNLKDGRVTDVPMDATVQEYLVMKTYDDFYQEACVSIPRMPREYDDAYEQRMHARAKEDFNRYQQYVVQEGLFGFGMISIDDDRVPTHINLNLGPFSDKDHRDYIVKLQLYFETKNHKITKKQLESAQIMTSIDPFMGINKYLCNQIKSYSTPDMTNEAKNVTPETIWDICRPVKALIPVEPIDKYMLIVWFEVDMYKNGQTKEFAISAAIPVKGSSKGATQDMKNVTPSFDTSESIKNINNYMSKKEALKESYELNVPVRDGFEYFQEANEQSKKLRKKHQDFMKSEYTESDRKKMTNRQKNNVKKFLRDSDYDPKTKTIKTDIIDSNGKPVRVKFDTKINPDELGVDDLSSIPKSLRIGVTQVADEAKDAKIIMGKEMIKKKPWLSAGTLKHEEGHFASKYYPNKVGKGYGLSNEKYPHNRFAKAQREGEKLIAQAASLGRLNDHGANPDEFVADRYSIEHNPYGKKKAIKLMDMFSYDTEILKVLDSTFNQIRRTVKDQWDSGIDDLGFDDFIDTMIASIDEATNVFSDDEGPAVKVALQQLTDRKKVLQKMKDAVSKLQGDEKTDKQKELIVKDIDKQVEDYKKLTKYENARRKKYAQYVVNESTSYEARDVINDLYSDPYFLFNEIFAESDWSEVDDVVKLVQEAIDFGDTGDDTTPPEGSSTADTSDDDAPTVSGGNPGEDSETADDDKVQVDTNDVSDQIVDKVSDATSDTDTGDDTLNTTDPEIDDTSLDDSTDDANTDDTATGSKDIDNELDSLDDTTTSTDDAGGYDTSAVDMSNIDNMTIDELLKQGSDKLKGMTLNQLKSFLSDGTESEAVQQEAFFLTTKNINSEIDVHLRNALGILNSEEMDIETLITSFKKEGKQLNRVLSKASKMKKLYSEEERKDIGILNKCLIDLTTTLKMSKDQNYVSTVKRLIQAFTSQSKVVANIVEAHKPKKVNESYNIDDLYDEIMQDRS